MTIRIPLNTTFPQNYPLWVGHYCQDELDNITTDSVIPILVERIIGWVLAHQPTGEDKMIIVTSNGRINSRRVICAIGSSYSDVYSDTRFMAIDYIREKANEQRSV